MVNKTVKKELKNIMDNLFEVYPDSEGQETSIRYQYTGIKNSDGSYESDIGWTIGNGGNIEEPDLDKNKWYVFVVDYYESGEEEECEYYTFNSEEEAIRFCLVGILTGPLDEIILNGLLEEFEDDFKLLNPPYDKDQFIYLKESLRIIEEMVRLRSLITNYLNGIKIKQ